MKRRRKILIAIVSVPILLLLAGLLYLRFGDLGWVREPAVRRISDALGRELTVSGEFNIEVLPSIRLVAGDVTLASPDWSDEPAMVHVDRLELAIDLLSLLNRAPVVLHDLQIKGARIRLERDAEGRASWDFELEPKPRLTIKPEERRIIFERIRLDDVELTYRDPSREAPLRFAIQRLEAELEEAGIVAALNLEGSFDRFPAELTGRITALAGLLEGEPLQYDLRGHLGKIEVVSKGEIADIATLGGPDLEMRLDGPDLERITDFLGLLSLGSGPFELGGRVSPSPDGVELSLDADLVDLQAEAHGHADTLINPQEMNLEVKASGADLYAAGSLLGWKNLPTGEFEASAGLSSDGTSVTLDRLKARLGAHVASVEGVLRTSTDVVDEELKFEAKGPDLSVFSAMVGANLAERSYQLNGHLVRVPDGISVESLVGRVGDIKVQMSGTLEQVFRFSGADLRVRSSGPDLSAIRVLSHLALPPGSFVLDGRMKTIDEAIVFEDCEGRAGNTAVSLDGTVTLAPDYVGTSLRARVAGEDPSWFAPAIGLQKLPVAPYDFSGDIRFTETGPRLDAIEGTYGDVTFELDGELSDLLVRLSGPDLSWLAGFGAPDWLPAERFELDGRVRTLDVGYELEQFKATLGSMALELDGRLGDLPDVDGTDVELKVQGPDLSALSAYADLPLLPTERFSVAGHLTVESGSYRLKAVSGGLGLHHLAADGTLVPSTGLVGTTLELEVSGSDLADAGRIASELGVGGLSRLPQTTYSLSGEVRVDESGYDLLRLVARVAEAEARIAGRLGQLPDGHGTDLTVEARGPDASVIAAIGALALPAAPFSLHGRVEHDQYGSRFHGVVADLGDYHAEIDGTLGEPPRLEGTNLDIRLSGPDLSLISDFVDLPPLPHKPFEMSAHFDGSSTQFSMRRFSSRLGRSDLAGEFRVDLTGSKPDLEGEFTSERFDLVELLEDEAEDEAEEQPETDGEFLISDDPLSFDLFDKLDADVRWTVDQFIDSRAALGNVELAAHLLDGRFTLDPVQAAGYGGTYSGTLILEPVEDGYHLHVAAKAEQVRLSLLDYSGDPSEIAPVDLDLELTGQGRSLHAIASSADGQLMYVGGSGRLDNSLLTTIAADPLSKLYVSLNPFTKTDPYTKLECSVLLIEMSDGVAQLGPFAMRTDKMVMLGHGQIDLESEKLKLDWATKPRKGVGLSAGTITNSYIKLGGTLSTPHITISPLKAAGEASATVATAGLWLLYRSLANRVTAERKVCKLALKKAAKKAKKRTRQTQE